MGIFDFFKTKKVQTNAGSEISFQIKFENEKISKSLKEGDYVNLWTKPELEKVIIYAPNTIGGNGQLGIIPPDYFKAIKKHILNSRDFGFSGPSTNNYEAFITNITNSSCTIKIKLLSEKEHEEIIKNFIEKEKNTTKMELEKKYQMSKPVQVSFYLKSKEEFIIEDLSLKILDKEYYIENPFELKLQLISNEKKIIAETHSQRDKVLRVIKANQNGQELKLDKMEKFDEYISVIIDSK
jgi:hypothetical protein